MMLLYFLVDEGGVYIISTRGVHDWCKNLATICQEVMRPAAGRREMLVLASSREADPFWVPKDML